MTKKSAVYIIICLVIILAAGCSYNKTQLPISPDAYLKNFGITLPETQEDLKKEVEGILEPPPSIPKNIAYKNVIGFDEYVVGPTDELTIVSWKGSQKETIPIFVRPDGKISYSFLEDLEVAGLTPSEIDNLITSKVKDYLKNPRIDLLVSKYSNKQISISGPIKNVQGRPQSGAGIYPLTGKITLLNQLLNAGGFDEGADLSRVRLNREGKTYVVNVLELMKSAEASANDIILENGDIIIVPEFKRLEKKKLEPNKVYVFGEVNSVGVHDLTGAINVLDVISKAGGFNKNAKKNDVRIIRGTPENPVILISDVDRLLTKNDLTQLVTVKDGDIVFVASTALGKIDEFSKRIEEFLDLAKEPAIFRDLYTTGGFGRLDTGPPITGLKEGELGAPGAAIESRDILIREE